jgi:hypothetical protein
VKATATLENCATWPAPRNCKARALTTLASPRSACFPWTRALSHRRNPAPIRAGNSSPPTRGRQLRPGAPSRTQRAGVARVRFGRPGIRHARYRCQTRSRSAHGKNVSRSDQKKAENGRASDRGGVSCSKHNHQWRRRRLISTPSLPPRRKRWNLPIDFLSHMGQKICVDCASSFSDTCPMKQPD